MIAKNEHDENSPSALERREGCPGSRDAESGIVEKERAHQVRGTTLHGHIARLVALPEVKASDFDGISAEDLPSVEACVEQIRAAKAELGDKALVLIEHRLDLSRLRMPKGGTVDAAVLIPGGAAILIDHKMGVQWVRSPQWNRQIQAYAWGLVDSFACTTVKAMIVQPAAFSERNRLRWHLFTAHELLAIEPEIRGIVERTFEAGAPRRVGEHCQWCKAKDQCSARAMVAAEVSAIANPVADFKALSPLMRTAQWERIDLAIEVLKNAQRQIEEAALAGEVDVPGYKVGEGRKGSREWTDDAAAEVMLRRVCHDRGMNSDLAISRKVITPAAAEKLLGKVAAASAMAGLVRQEKGKPALVRGES